MRRATAEDAAFMSEIMAIPEVRRGMSGHHDTENIQDLNPLSMLEAGVVLVWDDGFFWFAGDGNVFDAHTCFRPNGDFFGRVRKAREAFRWIFLNTWADEIVTKVFVKNDVVKLLAMRSGMRVFAEDSRYLYFRLGLMEWISEGNSSLRADGIAALDEGDPINDCGSVAQSIVGFYRACVESGNAEKGSCWLLRYAFLLNFADRIKVEKEDPLQVALIGTKGGQ